MSQMSRRSFVLSASTLSLMSATKSRAQAQQIPNGMHITYDDGPDKVLTNLLLETLAVYGQKVTFFIVGKNIKGNESVLERMALGGHGIGNHSWSHPDMSKLSMDAIHEQLGATNRAIRDVVGFEPSVFRPPYGSFTEAQTRSVRDQMGMRKILWDVDTLDWQKPGEQLIAQRVAAGIKPGCVVLMHDIHPQTVYAAPFVLSLMLNSGYVSVPIV